VPATGVNINAEANTMKQPMFLNVGLQEDHQLEEVKDERGGFCGATLLEG
jgi:hypothetical protein